MNLFNIERSFKMKEERGWRTLYVVVDLHATMIKPYHHEVEFYPGCIEVLENLSRRRDVCLILWTSSHIGDIEKIDGKCLCNGIYFRHINQNPNETNTSQANFSQKFYFNILFEDKAGFEGETDWKLVKEELIRIGEWKEHKDWKSINDKKKKHNEKI